MWHVASKPTILPISMMCDVCIVMFTQKLVFSFQTSSTIVIHTLMYTRV